MKLVRWATGFAKRHPRRAAAITGLSLAALVFGIVWFEPHKLFLDERVNEVLPSPSAAAPSSAPASETVPPPSSEPAGPAVLARGKFRSLEHESSGVAKVVELPNGARVLRFEDLQTSNGPDLRVYLSEIPAGDDWYVYGERFLDLGDLKGNQGNQNYRIPGGADLSKVRSAVIWCRRFEVGFAVAPLEDL